MTALENEISALLGTIEVEAQRVAGLFSANDYSADMVQSLIKQSAGSVPELRGVTACYEPGEGPGEAPLFCPFYTKATGDFLFVEDSYDYSVPSDGTTWYTAPLNNGPTWAEPYYGAAANAWFIDYAVPFLW